MKNSYKIVSNPPLLWPVLKFWFRLTDKQFEDGLVIAFGRKIYSFKPVADHVLAPELVHLERQGYSYVKAIPYLLRFMLDKKFRLKEELVAFQAQYRFISRVNPEKKEFYLDALAKALTMPLYKVPITLTEAKQLICSNP